MKASQRAACIILGCSVASWLRNRQSSTEVITRIVGSSGVMASAAAGPSRQSLRPATFMKTPLRFRQPKPQRLQRPRTIPLVGDFVASKGIQHSGYNSRHYSALPFFTLAAFVAEFSGPRAIWVQDCPGHDTAMSIPVVVSFDTADLDFTSSKGTSFGAADVCSPPAKEVPVLCVMDGSDHESVSVATPAAVTAAAIGEDSPYDVVSSPRPRQLVSESDGHRNLGVQGPRPGSHKPPVRVRPASSTTGYWPAAHHTPVAVWQGPKKSGGKETPIRPSFPPPSPISKLGGRKTTARRNVGGLIATRMAVFEQS